MQHTTQHAFVDSAVLCGDTLSPPKDTTSSENDANISDHVRHHARVSQIAVY